MADSSKERGSRTAHPRAKHVSGKKIPVNISKCRMFTSEPRHFFVFRIHPLWELSILQIIPNIKVFVIKSVHMLTY